MKIFGRHFIVISLTEEEKDDLDAFALKKKLTFPLSIAIKDHLFEEIRVSKQIEDILHGKVIKKEL